MPPRNAGDVTNRLDETGGSPPPAARPGGIMFQKATKRAAKLRLAVDGPSGAGKTWTSLSIASVLADRVAVIDTERGSASLYSDRFDFDVIELAPPYEPVIAVEAIRAAEAAGYGALIIDSLSHFWDAEGGVMDMVDAASARSRGNKFAGWKVGTPAYRNLIDTMLSASLHVICTMRSKTEWVIEENDRGKSAPRKIGTSPVMRSGIEYEFTVVGDLDLEHRITITKSRCDAVADKVFHAHRERDFAETLKSWLASGAEPADADSIADIRQAIAAIADPDRRSDVKREFVARFGMPDFLLADKVADANGFIREQTGMSSPEPSTAGAAAPARAGEAPQGGTEGEVLYPSPQATANDSGAAVPPADDEPPAAWDTNDSVAERNHMPTRWRNDMSRRLARLHVTARDDVALVLDFATNRTKVLTGVRPDEAESVEEAIASLESGELVIEEGVITTKTRRTA
jgi:AAA domain